MNQRNERGFSLLELILVIAIVGIATAVAAPTFSEWRARSAVNNASKALLSHLKQARVMAMAENRSVKITFDTNSYTFDADTTGTCGLCKSQTVSFSNFSSNLSMTPTTTRSFSSRGTVNSGTITVASGSYTHQITINIIGRAYQQ